MTFAKNKLTVAHVKYGYGLEFNCLEALKTVKPDTGYALEVGIADAWKESRSDFEASRRILKKFDWTFSTDYTGTLIPASDGSPIVVEETTENIDMQRLMERNEILYYDSIDLYEDELADHGVAKMDVKIRVMKDYFYILMRYFLRIDQILARVQDVRIFHDVHKDFMLRDFTRKEISLKDADLPVEVLNDPVKLSTVLPLVFEQKHKLVFPSQIFLESDTSGQT
jgi:type 2A phosphatase activator TIP41